MTPKKPYKEFSDFLNSIFPFKVQKISVNAGFTCPNRDGTKGVGGCTYCNNQSFSPAYGGPRRSVTEQMDEGVAFFRRKYPQMKYLAYFQSYTNTYDSLEKLIALYEEALRYPDTVGIIVGTRPDCMPNELLNYFAELKKHTFVMIEYGLESTFDPTLQFINRGHTYAQSEEAIHRTAQKGIYTGAHIILGLPGESRELMLSHVDKLSALPLTSLKLHQLQLIRGTVMAKQYEAHPEWFNLFEVDEYIDLCIDFAERLNPDFVIERFVSQSPKELLIAPDWGLKNYEFTAKILKRFAQRETYQGRLYKHCQ
ncbi:radical SAM protein (TIGR01212 family) [Dysgonomonas sp. PH5-45]|uniref:TIGR01212 family radical SAM protein n=1 Tax=unclassified Dysgonomonas TaxID=2630389 RepID=UPI0024772269|nr:MULTISPECIES: TIGR01212 family radical SAM protein [unclassified Dysgonomonas]MDH6354908.1 radical SAM protein (TIGR01212 family) [Dysgonomonas sp. PH5-45]MDH6387807.1 radical SAM protein (TIGR01212 family) [Dysgonomonas sp. PH5-37]